MLLKELSALASPLNDQQIGQLKQAVSELTPQQLAWISGYFWGLSQNQTAAPAEGQPAGVPAAAAQPAGKLTIIYASQTGNAKGVAEALKSDAEAGGVAVSLFAADDYKPKNLGKETHVVVVTSTYGEGEPPENAVDLHEFIRSKKAPKMDGVKFAVIGLGDSSYEFFCQTAKDFDEAFAKLGGERIVDRLDCDVDYDAPAAEWCKTALEKVKETIGGGEPAGVIPLHPVAQSVANTYTKQSPYEAELLVSQKVTGRNSTKDVRHVEIDLGESGLTYQPGDALGIWYENDPALADEILAKVGLSGDESIEVDGNSLSLRDALVSKFEITSSNPQQVAKVAELSGSKKLAKLAEDKDKLRDYSAHTQLVDVLGEKKVKLDAEQLTGLLRRLTPRLYSIASSQEEVGEEVHLTVGVVEYAAGDNTRRGGASSFLSHGLEEGGKVKVFVEHNNNFKLPTDDNTPVIMIGPGTGIAPFRSFIQERDARDAEGKNWLFFGDRTFTEDFLYQVEWQKYLKSGLLTRADVAFSRDQKEKVYVQHRILEQGAEVWKWIEEGAHIYICGDANLMAKDVHGALLAVIEQYGGKSATEASDYLNELRKAKRYQKDVY